MNTLIEVNWDSFPDTGRLTITDIIGLYSAGDHPDKIVMDTEQALAVADHYGAGSVFDGEADFPLAALAVLAAEIRRLKSQVSQLALTERIRKPGEVGCVCCSTVLPSLAAYMAHACERVAA